MSENNWIAWFDGIRIVGPLGLFVIVLIVNQGRWPWLLERMALWAGIARSGGSRCFLQAAGA